MNYWTHGISGGQVSLWHYLSIKSDKIEIWELISFDLLLTKPFKVDIRKRITFPTNDRFAWDVWNSIIKLVAAFVYNLPKLNNVSIVFSQIR